MRKLGVASILFCGHVLAQSPDDVIAKANDWSAATCSASFAARQKEALTAIVEQDAYATAFLRVMPWYFEHCRQLTELERAIRKLDDPAAFVCDTAKGRPRELTTRFVLAHPGPMSIADFQDARLEDRYCRRYDPISLDMSDTELPDTPTKLDKARSILHQLRVMCFGRTSQWCSKSLELAAGAVAKLEAAAADTASAAESKPDTYPRNPYR